MKTLLLLRHAKPENAAGTMSDVDRALNDRGRGEAEAVGKYIQQHALKPELVMSSPAVRARETAELVLSAAGLEVNANFDQQIYEAGWRQLLVLLSEMEEETLSVLLVGHNPALEDLVHVLTDRTEHMTPFACSSLDDKMARMAGTLYLVATPIGNLEDITYRAVRILREVKVVACEDTRHTRKLLNHYGINTRAISYHEHNERDRAAELLKLLETGADVAVVSDAGTPGISDPGFQLARLAIEAGVQVVPLPGPSALIAALIASGLPTDEFYFGGFLPARSGARRTRLAELRSIPATLLFYEAPHRIAAALRDAYEILGEREAVVARELTKMHEEIARGRLSELGERFSSREHARGEMVLIIDRTMIENEKDAEDAPASIAELVEKLESEGLDHRAALKKAARALGLSRDEAYRRLVSERHDKRS